MCLVMVVLASLLLLLLLCLLLYNATAWPDLQSETEPLDLAFNYEE